MLHALNSVQCRLKTPPSKPLPLRPRHTTPPHRSTTTSCARHSSDSPSVISRSCGTRLSRACHQLPSAPPWASRPMASASWLCGRVTVCEPSTLTRTPTGRSVAPTMTSAVGCWLRWGATCGASCPSGSALASRSTWRRVFTRVALPSKWLKSTERCQRSWCRSSSSGVRRSLAHGLAQQAPG